MIAEVEEPVPERDAARVPNNGGVEPVLPPVPAKPPRGKPPPTTTIDG